MFKEIAVDPAAVATSYRDFSYIIEKFGISEGRLIASFPGRWRALVFEAAKKQLKGTTALSRIEVRMKALGDSILYKRGRPGDGCETDWIQSAIEEHRRLPFEAVITSTLSEVDGFVYVSDLDGEHPCMQSSRQWHVQRTSTAMAECCAPLLSTGRHIKLVDPYFDARAPRFRAPFLAFLNNRRPNSTIDVYRGDDCDTHAIAEHIRRALSGVDRRGGTLRLFLRPRAAMHNRFVLNEFGGVSFLTGLDEDFSTDRPTDLVTALEPGPFQTEWNIYEGEDSVAKFDI